MEFRRSVRKSNGEGAQWPLRMRRRRHGETTDTMALDEPSHQARRLCLFDEVSQECGTGQVFPRRADRLLNRHKASIEDACARQFFQIRQKPHLKARKRAQFRVDELLISAIKRF